MSLFSEKLSKYIAQKNIKIYQISRLSGIERTSLQKMLTGARKPSSKAQILLLAQALSLTNEETEELLDLYSILEMGEENWTRRHNVMRLIQSFRIEENPLVSEIPSSNFSFPENQDMVICSTPFQVSQTLHSILLQESFIPSGLIQIQAQPSFSSLINCLTSIDFNQIPIEHYICLDSDPTAKPDDLKIICGITPLLLNCPTYFSYGYYHHIDSLFSPAAFLPNLILTSQYMMAISSDYSSALISRSSNLMELCQKHFALQKQSSWPIFQPTKSFEEYLTVMLLGQSSDYSCCIMDHPCTLPFLTPEILQRILNHSAVSPDVMMQINSQISSTQDSSMKSDTYFSLSGLQKFMQSGRFTEVPAQYYSPLNPSEIRYLLDTVCQAAKAGHYRMHLMRSSYFEIPPHLCIGALSPQHVSIIFNHPQKGFSAFDVKNLSLSDSIYDFMEYLQKNDDLSFSPEESVSIVEGILRQSAI